MANLGSDNTPVKGQNFELPAGAQIDEDNGDFVVRDSSGTIVFRRDEANGEWNLEGTDLANIGSLDTDDIPTDSWEKWAIRDAVLDSGYFQHLFWNRVPTSNIFTSTSGSGAVKAQNNRYQLDTGTTSGSDAEMTTPIEAGQTGEAIAIADVSYADDWYFHYPVNIFDSASDRVDHYTVGQVQGGNKGFGFKLSGGDWLGVVHDGSSETTTTLQTGVSTGDYRLRADFEDGTVTWYINATEVGSSSGGEPSGATTGRGVEVESRVENTSGVQRRSHHTEFRLGVIA